MLEYNSNRRGDYNKFDSSRKEEVSTKIDSSNNFDSSNKQVKSSKKDNSDKLDGSINIKNIDPDCLMEKFTELYNNKYESFEESQPAREHCKEILAEFLRVKAITKREYNTLYKNCEK